MVEDRDSLRSISTLLFLLVAAAFLIRDDRSLAEDRSSSYPRVIGGQDSSADAWPWMVALVYSWIEDDSTEAQFCGGALVGEQHILTAAHCVDGMWPQDIQVMVGIADLPFGPGERLDISGVVIHPDYNPDTNEHDLALIKLKEPLNSPTVALAIEEVGNRTPAILLGWGQMDPDWPILPVRLQEATVLLGSDSVCIGELGRYFKPASMLCAGVLSDVPGKQPRDACYGDSGSPLIIPTGADGWKVIGVASWGFGCANPRARGVYAEVPAHIDFVTSFPDVAPTYLESPKVVGTPEVGQRVLCQPGEFIGDPPDKIFYQWFRDYNPISDANVKYYRLKQRDLEREVSCSVIATNSGGSSGEIWSQPIFVQPAGSSLCSSEPRKLAIEVKRLECAGRRCSVSFETSGCRLSERQLRGQVQFVYQKKQCKKKRPCLRTSREHHLRIKANRSQNLMQGLFRRRAQKARRARVTYYILNSLGETFKTGSKIVRVHKAST